MTSLTDLYHAALRQAQYCAQTYTDIDIAKACQGQIPQHNGFFVSLTTCKENEVL